MSQATRYTLLLDDGAVRTVDRLQRAYNLKNRAEVYDLAARVLTWMTEQVVNGKEVGRFANNEFQPLLIPYDVDAKTWKAAS